MYIYIYQHNQNQPLTPYLFQNDFSLHSGPYWNEDNAAHINIWCFIELNN